MLAVITAWMSVKSRGAPRSTRAVILDAMLSPEAFDANRVPGPGNGLGEFDIAIGDLDGEDGLGVALHLE
jgi:hypothetical protein